MDRKCRKRTAGSVYFLCTFIYLSENTDSLNFCQGKITFLSVPRAIHSLKLPGHKWGGPFGAWGLCAKNLKFFLSTAEVSHFEGQGCHKADRGRWMAPGKTEGQPQAVQALP